MLPQFESNFPSAYRFAELALTSSSLPSRQTLSILPVNTRSPGFSPLCCELSLTHAPGRFRVLLPSCRYNSQLGISPGAEATTINSIGIFAIM